VVFWTGALVFFFSSIIFFFFFVRVFGFFFSFFFFALLYPFCVFLAGGGGFVTFFFLGSVPVKGKFAKGGLRAVGWEGVTSLGVLPDDCEAASKFWLSVAAV